MKSKLEDMTGRLIQLSNYHPTRQALDLVIEYNNLVIQKHMEPEKAFETLNVKYMSMYQKKYGTLLPPPKQFIK